MHLQTENWGHVALLTPLTRAMELAEEECEMQMLYCRYGRRPFTNAWVKLGAAFPGIHDVLRNPNTLRDLTHLFE